jgi:hypothetical protein
MGWYRVYFLGPAGDIRNVDEFIAAEDASALTLAEGIYEAVSDLYAGYEVWQDSRRILRCLDQEARPFMSEKVVSKQLQLQMLKRLEILQESPTAFARSRRLIERLSALRELVGQSRQSKTFTAKSAQAGQGRRRWLGSRACP